ncbi:MAG: hypothetical protein ACJA0C_001196 [Candidatus Endobugula sp.]|jgi:hypothetical protein
MLVVKNSKSLYHGFLSLFIACVTALREQRRREHFTREMQRLDSHLLADIGFRRQGGDVLVSLKSESVAVSNALARGRRRQARLKAAFLVRRRQVLRNGRSGP